MPAPAAERWSVIFLGARVNENNPRSKPPALDYAAPSTRRGNPILGIVVGILGVCAGLFGAVMLFYAIPGVVYVFTRSNRGDFAGDLFEVVMFLVIGAFCLYVAIRWCRAVRGIIAGK